MTPIAIVAVIISAALVIVPLLYLFACALLNVYFKEKRSYIAFLVKTGADVSKIILDNIPESMIRRAKAEKRPPQEQAL